MTTTPPPGNALRQAEAEARYAQITDVRYALELEVDATSLTYEGRVTVRFGHREPDTGTWLDFTGGDILSLEVNGVACSPERVTPHRLSLQGSLLGPENEVRIAYRNPYDRTGVGFHRFVDPEDGEVYLYTDFEPFNAHRLFPSFDQPDLKAVFDVTVTAPAAWEVIANGAEVGRDDAGGGRSRRTFGNLAPFSTYLFAILAGPYAGRHEEGDIRLGLYCRRSLLPYLDHEEIFEVTRQGFRFYEDTFGRPYPFGKYDQVFVPEYNSGAMENVGAVTYNESQVFRDPPTENQRLSRAEVILHELAHMWFGNLVTMKWWDGLWLNESFATYISFVAMDRATRFQACWQNFLGAIKAWAYREDQKPTTHPIAGTVADTDETFLNFDGITYGKGAAVLKQLHATLGDDAFVRGLQGYFARHAFGNTTIDDFLSALGEAAGRDLGPWSLAWLERSGVNVIRPVRSAGAIGLIQEPGSGDAILRPHRLTIGYYRRATDGVLRCVASEDVDLTGPTRALPSAPADPDLIWPNLGDHGYARFFIDPPSLRCVEEHLTDVEDPLVRQGLWGTLWEMVRSAAISPPHYLRIGLRFLPKEPAEELLDGNLGRMASALAFYVDPASQGEHGHAWVEVAVEEAKRAREGSDRALMWTRDAVGFVRSAADAHRLLSWLEGEGPLGQTMDQGLRWRVLTRGAAFGLPGIEALLDAEAARDGSDRGVKARFAAGAALPDPKNKAALWSRFVSPGVEDSADLLKAAMGTFFWPHQAALLQPFAHAFFTDLPQVLAALDLEYASRGFARLLAPTPLADAHLVARAKAALGETSQPVLRRLLLELADELERATRLRGLS
jgi:aminopeptidase N